ncbi:MAG TPA: hypothetical protein VFB44_18735 [Thermoleophilaceae bacterium]|nr:hypothetical protein [Thermoleophilaceae bacterium]
MTLAGLRPAVGAFVLLAALLVWAAPASAGGRAFAAGKAVSVEAAAGGAKRVIYRIGPFTVKPGQNDIGYAPIVERPQVDGYITRIRPDLTYLDGKVPGVDVIHLHHGVWLNLSRSDATAPGLPERFFGTGEEKTRVNLPRGYGYPLRTSDSLILNHMIHNLTPVPTRVYMVYEIEFVPARSRAARGMRPVRPVWMDVQNGSAYPVFNVPKGGGSGGTYTYPDDAGNPYGGGPKLNEWVVDRPGVLVSTAGHLHPGGLHTDLYLRRRGAACARRAAARGPPPGPGRAACASRRAAGATPCTCSGRALATSSPPGPCPGTCR